MTENAPTLTDLKDADFADSGGDSVSGTRVRCRDCATLTDNMHNEEARSR